MAHFTATYDPGEVSFVWGTIMITGFASDTMITVERMTDTWSDQAGSDGFVTRARSRDKRGTVTVNLDMSSFDNDKLMAVLVQDELDGTGAFPLLMRDGSGTTVASAPFAWIVKPAVIEYGSGIAARQWQFRCDSLTVAVGGNT